MARPSLVIDSTRIVYNDGNHNAFTDLCRFQGDLFLTFRSCPDGHMVHPTSRIVILRSRDGRDWIKVHSFNVPGRDVRDPHLLPFGERLYVYTGTWLYHPENPEWRDANEHQGYASWTTDGVSWEAPTYLEGTYGHYIWRTATHSGKAYLCGYRKRGFAQTPREEQAALMQSALLESDDGLIWKYAGLFQESYGGEAAFLFEPDGAILAIGRGAGDHPAQVCRSQPPYRQWSRQDLECNVGGPMLAKWEGHYLVGGRRWAPEGPRTALYWLEGDELHLAAELSSGGDNSYPGFLPLNQDRGLVSYYSSHEGSGTSLAPSAIYLAEIRLA